MVLTRDLSHKDDGSIHVGYLVIWKESDVGGHNSGDDGKEMDE